MKCSARTISHFSIVQRKKNDIQLVVYIVPSNSNELVKKMMMICLYNHPWDDSVIIVERVNHPIP
jgi:hypothetical protein